MDGSNLVFIVVPTVISRWPWPSGSRCRSSRPEIPPGRSRQPGHWTGHRKIRHSWSARFALRSDRLEYEPGHMRTVTPCPFGIIEILFTLRPPRPLPHLAEPHDDNERDAAAAPASPSPAPGANSWAGARFAHEVPRPRPRRSGRLECEPRCGGWPARGSCAGSAGCGLTAGPPGSAGPLRP